MQQDIDRILIDRPTIARRVQAVAQQIIADYADLTRSHDPRDAAPASVTIVPILTGSFIFVADLIRHLPVYMQIQLISVSSYPGATTTQHQRMSLDLDGLPDSLLGRHVLLIDDILDSGNTITRVRQLLLQRNPASLRTCVLLRKQRDQALAVTVEYVCFDIPDQFVIGYGLDFNDYYRNLPEICTLRQEVIAQHQTLQAPDQPQAER